MESEIQTLEVWGEYACFTRPELKVERFSYPVITPSAARGIFDAVYWKPNFYWQVCEIELLSYPRFIALRRNEVKEKIGDRQIVGMMDGSAGLEPLWADANEQNNGRTQRQTMALKGIRYRLHAKVVVHEGTTGDRQAILAQFRRRAARGQCHYQPYFGCREFVSYFSLAREGSADRVPYSSDLGLMLYDVFDLSSINSSEVKPEISLFHAIVKEGALEVPDYRSAKVLKGMLATEAHDAATAL